MRNAVESSGNIGKLWYTKGQGKYLNWRRVEFVKIDKTFGSG